MSNTRKVVILFVHPPPLESRRLQRGAARGSGGVANGEATNTWRAPHINTSRTFYTGQVWHFFPYFLAFFHHFPQLILKFLPKSRVKKVAGEPRIVHWNAFLGKCLHRRVTWIDWFAAEVLKVSDSNFLCYPQMSQISAMTESGGASQPSRASSVVLPFSVSSLPRELQLVLSPKSDSQWGKPRE